MEPKEAYLYCFFEQLEEVTKLNENKEFLQNKNEVILLQKQLISMCKEMKNPKEAYELVENMMNTMYSQMLIREKAIYIYAYKEGVKFGSELLK